MESKTLDFTGLKIPRDYIYLQEDNRIMVYKTKGTCSSEIEFEVENGILTDIHFVGGCQGNTTGVAALAKGLPIDEVIEKLSGIQCGFRGTSCPDQLSKALIAYKENN